MSKKEISGRSGSRQSALSTLSRLCDRLPVFVLSSVSVYYVISSATLPFADDLWFGEAPVLAVVQLPKMAVEDRVQDSLITLVRNVGLGSGSPSPDRIATQPWALAVLFVLPSAICIALVAVMGRLNRCRTWVAVLFAAATLDAAVTIWFEQTSRLSLF